jgi:hypothetical protein
MALINGQECDTLLKISKLTINAQSKVITSMQTTITDQDTRFLDATHLADQYLAEKQAVEKDLKKARRRLLWTKVGWAATAVIGAVTTVLALVH